MCNLSPKHPRSSKHESKIISSWTLKHFRLVWFVAIADMILNWNIYSCTFLVHCQVGKMSNQQCWRQSNFFERSHVSKGARFGKAEFQLNECRCLYHPNESIELLDMILTRVSHIIRTWHITFIWLLQQHELVSSIMIYSNWSSWETMCRFSRDEMKRIYRGFKTECPTGVLR